MNKVKRDCFICALSIIELKQSLDVVYFMLE